MRKLIEDVKLFLNCKFYMVLLALTAAGAYGFAVTHQSIGMDDTVIPLYFEEGLAPYVGRWTLFVLNKIFHISDFAPWLVEMVSVIILMLSVTLWCILWKRICEPKVSLPMWSYVLVAGIFLSCPLISEVFVFYLHNGICLGYGVTALAAFALIGALNPGGSKRDFVKYIMLSSVLLTIVLGFYESFIIVYIIGVVMCFFLIRVLYDKKEESKWQRKLLPWMVGGVATVAVSLILRAIVLSVLKVVFRLEKLDNYNVLYRSYFGDIFAVEGELGMVLKRFFLKYYVNGIVYLPIAVLAISILFIGCYALYRSLRRKDIVLVLCAALLVVLPVFMSLVEGLATRYRTAQYVPLVCAFAVLLLVLELSRHRSPGWLSVCCYFLLGVLLFNQCVDMNKWFYLDYLKYQDAKTVMDQIAYDLKKEYDISKPIVFRGGYEVPVSISEEANVSLSSQEYRWISRLADPIDPYLTSKYFTSIGYNFAESPVISVLQWGVTAFDGTSQQLIAFWEMHGQDGFRCVTDLNLIEEAEQLRLEKSMPGYPKEGYILECENYIIVNFVDAN